MSTIVYRDGVLASDTRAYTGSIIPIGEKSKSRHYRSGIVAGITTSKPGTSERLFAWLGKILAQNDAPLDQILWEEADRLDGELGRFTILAVDNDRRAFLFEDSLFPSGPIEAPYYAVGSGREYAMGALDTGASAIDALRVACRADVYSDCPIDALKHDGYSWRLPR